MKKEQIRHSHSAQGHRRWEEAIKYPSHEQLREVLRESTSQGRAKTKQSCKEVDWSAAPFIGNRDPEKWSNTI